VEMAHEKLFRRLCKEGRTLRGIKEALAKVGCTVYRELSETSLVRNMLKALRDEPLDWSDLGED